MIKQYMLNIQMYNNSLSVNLLNISIIEIWAF